MTRAQVSRWVVAVTLLLAATSGPARGQCEIAELLASDSAPFGGLGSSVAISGDAVIIGSPGDDDLGSYSGSANIFRFDGRMWVQEAKLLASDGGPDDRFGRSVALDDGVAIVGTETVNAAYVFCYDGSSWTEQAKLVPWDGYGSLFGWSVAVHGDRAIVGAAADTEACQFCGAAYFFRFVRSKWVPDGKVHASDAQAGNLQWDFFGTSVSVKGDIAIVGKPRNWFPGPFGPGAAYIFRSTTDGWIEEAKLSASDAAVGDVFGLSVAIGDDVAVVGATCVAGSSCDWTGSAYVFRAFPVDSGGALWLQEATLDDRNGATNDNFGASVALDGDIAIVGAPGNDDNGDASGSAFIFTTVGQSWVHSAMLLPSNGAEGDYFGSAVGLSVDVAIVGAPGHDDTGPYSGSAYIFNVAQERCLTVGDLDGDGLVGITDFLILLMSWGPCLSPPEQCPADLSDDGSVGITDFLMLLVNWS